MRKMVSVVLSVIVLISFGCGSGGGSNNTDKRTTTTDTISISISPLTATVITGYSQTFTAMVTGSSNAAVTWSVQEGIVGGFITGDGNVYGLKNDGTYTASNVPGTYHIIVTSQADTSKSATATVIVVTPKDHLDKTFGDNGKVITDIGVSNDNAKALAIQPDGKIVAAGYSGYDFALVRYNPDASLDNTFGNNGRVTAGINSSGGVKSIDLQSDGKILVAGSSVNSGYYDFILLRFNADGSLDTTFGKTGKVITDFSDRDEATALTIQSDGKIVIAGGSDNGGTYDFALARYNMDGSLDTTFGVGGKVTTDFGGTENATAIGLQFDGKIVVAGYSSKSSTYDFAIARYRTDGTLDTSFGNGGTVTTAIGISHDYARAISIQQDGKIVIAGEIFDLNPGGSMNFALARFNPDGSLDTTFGTDGKTTTDFGTTDDYANALTIQSDGRIVVAGYSTVRNSSVTNFVLSQYNPDGSLDPVFGEAGKMTIDFSGSAVANALAIQTDNRIVVVGMTVDPYNSSSEDFALVRINSNGSLDTTFGDDGKITTSILFDGYPNVIGIQSDGKIVTAGVAKAGGNLEDFALIRYNPDGSLDANFGNDGKVTTDMGGGDGVKAIISLTDGKIVVAGYSYARPGRGSYYDFALARYNPNGSLDTTLGDKGKVVTNINAFISEEAFIAAFQEDGKIVVAESFLNQENDTADFGLMRFNPDGSLDTAFGTYGVVSTDFGIYRHDYAKAIWIQQDGKIVVAGFSSGAGGNDFALARLNPDGGLDTAFGVGGKVIIDFSIYSSNDIARTIAIDGNGKIVVAGSSSGVPAVVRLNPDGSLDTTFGDGGKVRTKISDIGDAVAVLAFQVDGKIIAGVSLGGDFAVIRYNPDGSLDTTFGGGGIATTDMGGGDYLRTLSIQTDGKIVLAGASSKAGRYSFAVARYFP